MWKKLRQYFEMLSDYRVMMKGSKFFDRNPLVQSRFEENEEWLEHLEDRVAILEEDSHPPKDLCEFDSWGSINNRFKKIEEKLGIEYQHTDS
jgi:hypothetical protein